MQMHNCIFTPHCTEAICDQSCPILAETSYLLERNGVEMSSPVFNSRPEDIKNAVSIIQKTESRYDKFSVVTCNNTIGVSNLLTYCAICQNWKGNRLHCNVYNLKFSNYIEEIKQSWSRKTPPDKLEYKQIWAATSKILIISNLDFVRFQDFEIQTLLNLIHSRMDKGLTTVVVSPKLTTLVGDGQFYHRMQGMFGKAVISWQ